MPSTEEILRESRHLVRQHGVRLGRIWFVGAAILVMMGLGMAVWVLASHPADGMRRERLLAGIAIMAIGLPLIPLGLFQIWLVRRMAARGVVTCCRITGDGPEGLVMTMVGGNLVMLLRNLVPMRVVRFVPEGTGTPVIGHLFGDEEPIADETGYRCLQTSLMRRPVHLLVCRRRRRINPPRDAIEETGRIVLGDG